MNKRLTNLWNFCMLPFSVDTDETATKELEKEHQSQSSPGTSSTKSTIMEEEEEGGQEAQEGEITQNSPAEETRQNSASTSERDDRAAFKTPQVRI